MAYISRERVCKNRRGTTTASNRHVNGHRKLRDHILTEKNRTGRWDSKWSEAKNSKAHLP